MMLNLSHNAVAVQPMQMAFINESTFFYCQNQTLVQLRDSIQPKLVKLDGQVYITQNYAYSQDLNTVYRLPNFENIGIVTAFEPLVNIFEFQSQLILHFTDKIILFKDSQNQLAAEVQSTASTNLNSTIILGSGVTLFTYSPSLKLLTQLEIDLQQTEQIKQIQAFASFILILTTSGRIMLSDNVSPSLTEIYRGEVTKFVTGPQINGILLTIIESSKLTIIRLSTSGNGLKTIFSHKFDENVRDFVFVPDFQMQRFLNDINAIGVALTSKIQAICVQNSDLFIVPTRFRNIESEYIQLQKLKNQLLKEKSPTDDFIAPVALNTELVNQSNLITISISSPQFCVYFDVHFPSGLYVFSGEFDVIQPNAVRIYAKEKAEISFKMLPGFQYFKQQKFVIYAISESYQTGVKVVNLEPFSTFKVIQKLPKVDAFVTAELEERLQNVSISTPADFLSVKTVDGKTIIRGSSFITVNGYLEQQTQKTNLTMNFDVKGLVTRLNAFIKVFQGQENEFEYEKIYQDILQAHKLQNIQINENLVRRGLNLIKSGLENAPQMGFNMIKKAIE